MTEEQIALARRAVACRGWRWMPGMLTGDGFRVCRVDDDGYKFGWSNNNYAYRIPTDVLPDLTDPATLGCLLALVREARRELFALIECKGGGWEVYGGHCDFVNFGNTEAEAIVAALEAAPCGQ